MASPSIPSGGVDWSLSLWWAHHSHRYLVPAIGGTAVAAGVAFTFLGPAPAAVPPQGILLMLGAAAISISLITTALRIRLESDWRAPAAPAPAVAAPVCPACAEPAESHHAAHDFLRQIEVWSLLRRRGSSAAFASTTGATPSDFIWSSWAPAVTGLPVPLVGPVPETAYVAPRPGEPDRFPEHGVPSLPISPVGRAPLPPTAGDADPTSPPLPPFGRMEPSSDALAGFELPGPLLSAPTGPMGGEAMGETGGLDWIHREALSPIPPHLRRPSATRVPEASRSRPVPDPATQPPICATCQERIPNPAVWRRCPDCYRPICPECIVSALLEQDRGWCESCAEARVEAELRVAS
jgi:hypothetical protein